MSRVPPLAMLYRHAQLSARLPVIYLQYGCLTFAEQRHGGTGVIVALGVHRIHIPPVRSHTPGIAAVMRQLGPHPRHQVLLGMCSGLQVAHS